MMQITVNIEESDLKRVILQDESLKELLANKLHREFIDSSFDEIKGEFTEIARGVIREVVAEYVRDYYEKKTIGRDVEQAFKNLTKQDLLRLIENKL